MSTLLSLRIWPGSGVAAQIAGLGTPAGVLPHLTANLPAPLASNFGYPAQTFTLRPGETDAAAAAPARSWRDER